MTLGTQTTEPAPARQALADWLEICCDLLKIVNGGALEDLDNQQLIEFIQEIERSRDTISLIERGRRPQELPSVRIMTSIVQVHNQFVDQVL